MKPVFYYPAIVCCVNRRPPSERVNGDLKEDDACLGWDGWNFGQWWEFKMRKTISFKYYSVSASIYTMYCNILLLLLLSMWICEPTHLHQKNGAACGFIFIIIIIVSFTEHYNDRSVYAQNTHVS